MKSVVSSSAWLRVREVGPGRWARQPTSRTGTPKVRSPPPEGGHQFLDRSFARLRSAILPMNLKMPSLIANDLRILRFMGATRAKNSGWSHFVRGSSHAPAKAGTPNGLGQRLAGFEVPPIGGRVQNETAAKQFAALAQPGSLRPVSAHCQPPPDRPEAPGRVCPLGAEHHGAPGERTSTTSLNDRFTLPAALRRSCHQELPLLPQFANLSFNSED
jgi:hypothetical protein